MNRRMLAALTTVALLLPGAVAVPAVAAQTPHDHADSQALARSGAAEILANTKASSISIALVDGDRTAWTVTAGAVDNTATKPSAATLYGIGSVSKMLATIAVMQLVDAGKVSLDAPVTDYITDFRMASPEYRQITVRMLLDHTAGLPGTDYANAFTSIPYTGYADQVLQTLTHSRLKTTPGSMAVYCNDCFTLAGLVAERVSGQSYPDYVTEHILRPLGMTTSRYATQPLASGTYAPVLTDAGTLPVELTSIYASGGLLSTPTEMGRLAAMLMNHGTLDGTRILSADAVTEMGTNQLPTTLVGPRPPLFKYGLGWDTVEEPGLHTAGVSGWVKGGDTAQYHAAFTLAPDNDIAAVVLAAGVTVDSGTLEALAQKIVLTALDEKDFIASVPSPLPMTTPRSAPATATQVSNYTGVYLAQGTAFRLTPRADGGMDFSTFTKGQWVPGPAPFTMRTDGRLWSTAAPVALSLVRGWGRTYLVLDRIGATGIYREKITLGQKTGSIGAPAAAWQSRVGQTWLVVNEVPSSALWQTLPTLTLQPIPGLEGYLWVQDGLAPAPVDATGNPDVATMFLVIPIAQGRDLNDLEAQNRSDGTWLRFGGSVYRPLSSTPSLTAGTTRVQFSENGVAEWLQIPTAGTLTITGAERWYAYGPDGTRVSSGAGDGSAVIVTAGTLLAIFAEQGDVAVVTHAG